MAGSTEHMPGGIFSHNDTIGALFQDSWKLQFMSNILHTGNASFVTPFQQISTLAVKSLKHFGIKADLIYLDASHERGDVYEDIKAFFPLLKDNGTLCGDDYNWLGVCHDTCLYSIKHSALLKLIEVQDSKFNSPQWILTKGKNKMTIGKTVGLWSKLMNILAISLFLSSFVQKNKHFIKKYVLPGFIYKLFGKILNSYSRS